MWDDLSKSAEKFIEEKNWVDGLFKLGNWLVKAITYFLESCGTIKRWIGEIIGYFDNRTTLSELSKVLIIN